ncbi:MAG: LysM peptidoglycan-binding domain-containing protein [Bacteroidia bacterium]|nr:LysM peptidoglycan-binding domain-containing protein [Bacteroidia bacterium]MDW8014718.1 LysM peptidoglycan-binding domain-containing protein [Bacteroidia bacterium]
MQAVVTAPSSGEGVRVLSIWVGWTAEADSTRREVLSIMLKNAGYEVEVGGEYNPIVLSQVGQRYDAAFLIIGTTKGPILPDGSLLLRRQYDALLQQVSPTFRLLIWAPLDETALYDVEVQELLTHVENTLTERVMLTRTSSLPLLVGEVRAFLSEAVEARQAVKQYEIGFIHNVRDAASCFSLVETLSQRYRLQSLSFRPEVAEADTAEALRLYQQSQLLVLFFHRAGDWAVSLAQQIWKAGGGLSRPTPMLLLGLPTPVRNRHLSIQVPNIRLRLTEPENLEEEITTALAEARSTSVWPDTPHLCPYIGLRPFEEKEAVFFHGRERHISKILEQLREKKFIMITGSSGDGKSSLVFAGVLPALRANLMSAPYPGWAIAAFRPEKQPLTNLASALASALGYSDVGRVETRLSYGFSALVELYKESQAYIDPTAPDFLRLPDEEKLLRLREGQNLLVLVDQFEEFFTNEENYSAGVASPLAQITVNVLSETIRIAQRDNLPIWVIFTMRSDFIGQCVAFHGFAELIGESTYFVPRLSREEFQAVIEKPVELNGERITPRLTQRLLNDLGDGIDQLPVLQHVLHRIWHAAQEGKEPLDLLHYAMVGGLSANKLSEQDRPLFEKYLASLPQVEKDLYESPKLRNVLNFHAEWLYSHLDVLYEKQYGEALSLELLQVIAQTLFVSLTRIDEGRAVRARLTLQQITDILGMQGITSAVVARVAALFRFPQVSFLQPILLEGASYELSPTDTLTISHEALIRNWDRLIRWAESEAQSVRIFRELKFQVQRWLAAQQNVRLLLSGGAYQYFSEWYYERRPNPAWMRRYIPPEEFVPDVEPLTQAIALRDAIELYLARSKARIERNRRLLLLALAVITILFLLSLIALYYAQTQRLLAEKNAAEARRQAQIAQEQRMLAEKNAAEARYQQLVAERERLIALQQKLLAENALRIAQAERLNAEKQRQVAETQRRIAELERERALIQQRIAENQTRLADAARINAEHDRHQAEYQTKLAVIQRNKALILQSLFLAALSEDQTRQGKPEIGARLAMEALPRTIGAPEERPYVEEAEAALYYALHALLYPKPLKRFIGHKNRVVYAVFSPDGKSLATASWDKTIRVWDVQTGASQEVLKGHTHIVEKVYFSQDLRFLVSLAEDFSARVWDLSKGQSTARLWGHRDNLTHVALSSDGSVVLTTSLDKTARLWQGSSGTLLHTLRVESEVLHGALTRDGKRAVISTQGGVLYLFPSISELNQTRLQAHDGPISQVLLSPDEQAILALSEDGTASLWSWDGRFMARLQGHRGALKAAAFSPDGTKVVTAGVDSTLRVWEVPTGRLLSTLHGHKGIPYAVQWSPTGLHILSIGTDQRARLWSGRSFLQLTEYPFPLHIYFKPAFSPDGKLLVVPGAKGAVLLYPLLPDKQALIDFAYEQNLRLLTGAERRRFFLEDPRITSEIPSHKKLPRARIHEVQGGETLFSIAEKYNVSVEQLRMLNRLSSDAIRPGDNLIITYQEE